MSRLLPLFDSLLDADHLIEAAVNHVGFLPENRATVKVRFWYILRKESWNKAEAIHQKQIIAALEEVDGGAVPAMGRDRAVVLRVAPSERDFVGRKTMLIPMS